MLYKKIVQKNHKNLKLIAVLMILFLMNACSTMSNMSNYNMNSKETPLLLAQKEVLEKDLINISIHIFEPGKLPQSEEDRLGLSEEIRNAEARYIPIHLKYTLQRTGFWANVRVVPDENPGSEIIVKGEIINSDGENIELRIKAYDSSNKLWLDKTYKESVNINQQKITEIEKTDRYQNLYNNISNDLNNYRKKLTTSDIKKIKQIAELKFANYIAPTIYSGYIGINSNNYFNSRKIVQLKKLPANNDTMMKRVATIRLRDEMLIDTINNYYDIYYSELWDSYDNWRKFRSEELEAIREINLKATTQKILGVAAIIGAIALGASHNNNVVNSTDALRTIMIAGGSYAVYNGFQISKESQINKEALEEIGASFAVEVEPIVIDVNGKTTRLTGSAEQQYDKWRKVLKKIYENETAF